jgi:hypothetical protein
MNHGQFDALNMVTNSPLETRIKALTQDIMVISEFGKILSSNHKSTNIILMLQGNIKVDKAIQKYGFKLTLISTKPTLVQYELN